MAADTIFAVSSGIPPAAIAVIRISGPAAVAAGARIAGRLPRPRHAAVRDLRDADGELLDRALVLFMPAPNTATGDDVVELHCHGGRAVVDAVQAVLAGFPTLRCAEPGEFTRRALTNGRIDLLEAEGLADLLAAETDAQRRLALSGVGGRLSGKVRRWMDDLALAAADVEVQIDYADEGDLVTNMSLTQPLAVIDRVVGEMQELLAQPSVDRIRDGTRVVIAGPPNTGKSSLVNLLCGREVAITSPLSGTTRDRLEAPVARAGVAFVLTDTAGVRETEDVVERLGIERAHQAQAEADLVLWTGDDVCQATPGQVLLHLWTRCDLPGREVAPPGAVSVSIADDQVVDRLWALIGEHAPPQPRSDILFNKRQKEAVEDVLATLSNDALVRRDIVLIAEILRRARCGLAKLTGEDASETMLDALFSRFCLGK